MSKFAKLKSVLENKGYSQESAGSIAYSAGKKKYGKKVMAKAAQKGVSAESIKKGNK